MATLILVRHAEAQHHVQDLTGGWTDTVLTERGQQQALRLAERLKNELAGRPVELLCSDLQRAVQTADVLGQALGVPSRREPALRDINNGQAAGLSRDQARSIAIPPSEPILDWRPYPEGESWREFAQRVVAFMENYTPSQPLAVLVTHAVTIHTIVQWWLGLELERPVHFSAEPASLSVIRTTRWQERSLERLNDTAHLLADGLALPLHL